MSSNSDWMLLKECSECMSCAQNGKILFPISVEELKQRNSSIQWFFWGIEQTHSGNLQDPTEDPLLSLDLSSAESQFLVKCMLSLFSCRGQDKGEPEAQHLTGVSEAWITTITVNCAEGLYLKGLVGGTLLVSLLVCQPSDQGALGSWVVCLAMASRPLQFMTGKNAEMLQEKAEYLCSILFCELVVLNWKIRKKPKELGCQSDKCLTNTVLI